MPFKGLHIYIYIYIVLQALSIFVLAFLEVRVLGFGVLGCVGFWV